MMIIINPAYNPNSKVSRFFFMSMNAIHYNKTRQGACKTQPREQRETSGRRARHERDTSERPTRSSNQPESGKDQQETSKNPARYQKDTSEETGERPARDQKETKDTPSRHHRDTTETPPRTLQSHHRDTGTPRRAPPGPAAGNPTAPDRL